MSCAFCGHEFNEDEAKRGCKNCPTAFGCKMLKCPRCNYENPPEVGWLKRLPRALGRLSRGMKGF